MKNNRPSSNLRNHYNDISKKYREDSAIMGLQTYVQTNSELELLKTLEGADEDYIYGRVDTMKSTFDNIRNQLLERV